MVSSPDKITPSVIKQALPLMSKTGPIKVSRITSNCFHVSRPNEPSAKILILSNSCVVLDAE